VNDQQAIRVVLVTVRFGLGGVARVVEKMEDVAPVSLASRRKRK
jgi:hypothetical protein